MKNGSRSGISKHPLYHRCFDARARCLNEKNKRYASYGGRGIGVYGPWADDISLFVNYVAGLDGSSDSSLTLDRIDNDEGYFPGNLRFATIATQNRNRRAQSKCGVKGVSQQHGKYVASVHLGSFNTATEAAEAYLNALRKLELE